MSSAESRIDKIGTWFWRAILLGFSLLGVAGSYKTGSLEACVPMGLFVAWYGRALYKHLFPTPIRYFLRTTGANGGSGIAGEYTWTVTTFFRLEEISGIHLIKTAYKGDNRSYGENYRLDKEDEHTFGVMPVFCHDGVYMNWGEYRKAKTSDLRRTLGAFG